jgi:hypothetical protein
MMKVRILSNQLGVLLRVLVLCNTFFSMEELHARTILPNVLYCGLCEALQRAYF